MDKEKKARLEAHGWRVGSAEELLGMTPQEAAYVDLRLKLSDAVREYRKKRHLTQVQLAELLHSSQSRVAKVEAADESVSLDLPDADVETAWRQEVAARVAALEAGKVTTTPWEEIRDRFLARLSERRQG